MTAKQDNKGLMPNTFMLFSQFYQKFVQHYKLTLSLITALSLTFKFTKDRQVLKEIRLPHSLAI